MNIIKLTKTCLRPLYIYIFISTPEVCIDTILITAVVTEICAVHFKTIIDFVPFLKDDHYENRANITNPV